MRVHSTHKGEEAGAWKRQRPPWCARHSQGPSLRLRGDFRFRSCTATAGDVGFAENTGGLYPRVALGIHLALPGSDRPPPCARAMRVGSIRGITHRTAALAGSALPSAGARARPRACTSLGAHVLTPHRNRPRPPYCVRQFPFALSTKTGCRVDRHPQWPCHETQKRISLSCPPVPAVTLP